MKSNITTFEEARDYIFDTPKFTTKNDSEATKAFLHRLGDPDRNFKIIHVAGTNGKGSVCAYLRSILEHNGYKVSVFTSPHLVDVRERFICEGQMISKEDFLEAFLIIYENIDDPKKYHPTFFEFMFFIAMLVFSKKKPDYCILETGLGGRLDATNTVSKKEIAVITGISLDHMAYLGNTVEEIAGEKAGILMENVPVVYLNNPPAGSIIEERAKQMSCTAFPVSKSDYSFLKIKNKSIDFSYISSYYGNIELHLSTMARYQMENCSLALRTIEALGLCEKISLETIKEAVSETFWPGRMEEVCADVFVDGAHNEDGIRAFLETVKGDGYKGVRKLLFSVVSDKDYEKMLMKIGNSELFECIDLVHLNSYRATEISTMHEVLKKCKIKVGKSFNNVEEALEELLPKRNDGERIYIAGSLYLVGEVKEYLQGENND